MQLPVVSRKQFDRLRKEVQDMKADIQRLEQTIRTLSMGTSPALRHPAPVAAHSAAATCRTCDNKKFVPTTTGMKRCWGCS